MSGEPRLPPLPLAEWSDETKEAVLAWLRPELVERYLSSGPDAIPVPNVIGTLAHHPKLARRFLAFNLGLLYRSALGDRLRELLILRVARRTHSTYEWVQHANMAADCGITPAEVNAIAAGSDPGSWSPLEAASLEAVDQMVDHYRIDDETWSRLAKELDERQLVEFAFVVGTYTCLAMAFNSFDMEIEPELQGVAVPALPATQD